MFTANDAVSTAIQLTFTFETGFTNLQFLGMAADAMNVGDLDFGALISSIQTDEARHAQQGEPTIKILVENGKGDIAQKLRGPHVLAGWHSSLCSPGCRWTTTRRWSTARTRSRSS